MYCSNSFMEMGTKWLKHVEIQATKCAHIRHIMYNIYLFDLLENIYIYIYPMVKRRDFGIWYSEFHVAQATIFSLIYFKTSTNKYVNEKAQWDGIYIAMLS